ncbi:MAG: YfhO family protein [Firmicutes bacterium]|nr:YfhO family protein [Bacillota bacterium]
MQNRWNRVRAVRILLLSFLLPPAVLLAVYASFGIAPFGEKSLLIMDLSDQYVEFYANLRHMGQNGDIFFSWGKAMGGNYTGVFAYYLSSPFSFLVLLFPQEKITTALLVMNLLKIGCAGLSCSLFLRRRFEDWNGWYPAFAMAYALMSYNIVYSMCLMWLDGVIWLPLVLAGVDEVLRGRRPWLLFGSLAVLFVSNYYTSYMVVLAAILYFLLRLFGERAANPRLFPRKLVWCAGAVAGAAGMGAWLLVPTLCSLLQGKIGASGNAGAAAFNFDLSQLPTKFLPGVYDSITNSGLPSVFCGGLVLLLVFCFFVHPVFSGRERAFSGAVLAVFLISFWIGPLDTVWHVFQVPNWFPYRYAFAFGFFAVYLAARAFLSLRELPVRRYGAAVVLWAAFCLAAYLLWNSRRAEAILIALLAGCVYGLLLLAANRKKTKQAAAATAVLLLCGTAEFFYNGSKLVSGLDGQFHYKTEASYTDFLAQVQPLVDAANTAAGDTFFRMEKDFERSKNDALGLGYNGITHYSSAYSRSVNSFLKSLGMSQAYFWDSYYGATPVTDALFSVRYLMMCGEVCSWYSAVQSSGDITLYENPDVLSLAFAACGDPEVVLSGDPFANQEALLKAAIPYDGSCWGEVSGLTVSAADVVQTQRGSETVFEKNGSSPAVSYTFCTAEAGPVYAYFTAPSASSCAVSVNGTARGTHFTNETRKTIYLGSFDAGEKVEVCFVMKGSTLTIGDIFIRTLREEKLRGQLQRLSNCQLSIENYSARHVSGTVTAKEDGFLFTSIPYDSGWSVTVDGVPTETFSVGETLLAVPLSEGGHRVELSYAPAGLAVGTAITLLTLLVLLVVLLFLLRKKRKPCASQKRMEDTDDGTEDSVSEAG